MPSDQSGLRWPAWPLVGAMSAGRNDELPAAPAGFTLTPSGQAEQAAQTAEILDVPAELLGREVPGAGSE